jgi:hypothetical protein
MDVGFTLMVCWVIFHRHRHVRRFISFADLQPSKCSLSGSSRSVIRRTVGLGYYQRFYVERIYITLE